MKYFGPLTNNPGPTKTNKINQYSISPKLSIQKKINSNLNGFFMVFSKKVLIKNKFDNLNYFDPKYPFGGNETEWYKRFLNINGEPIVIPRTFIYHYKLAKWRNKELNEICIYTVNTGNYEGNQINLTKNNIDIDTLYYTDNFYNIYKCISSGLIPFYVDTTNKDCKLIQRSIKVCPLLYLPHNYIRHVYVDGNVFIKIIICYKHI